MDITATNLKNFSKIFNQFDKNKLAKNAVSQNSIDNLLINRDSQQHINTIFSKVVDINRDISISDQKNSGRCWMFSYLNMIKYKMEKKYKLKNFEFSQSHIHFYDKLEKCNFFLHMILKTKKEAINSRIIKNILCNPINDGGNWNMFVNIVNKYGVIPKECFNESFQSNNTYLINKFLNNKLRDYAIYIREESSKKYSVKKYIEECMQEIYNILVICIGEPPKEFEWKYYSNTKTSKKYNILDNITPLEFYKKYVPFNVDDMLVLVNNPCKPYYNKISVENFNNMKGGVEIEYLNIPINLLKDILKKSIDNNEVISFGCDVDKYINTKLGVLDINSIDYRILFNTDIDSNKKNRLSYLISDVTHAMVIRGYDNEKKTKKKKGGKKLTKKNKIIKYMVENSWGKESGKNGYLIMSDRYFDEYAYMIVVNKKYVPNTIKDIRKKKPIVLKPWEPFGNLLLH
jgi:bleomycin hydrolase